MILEALRDIAIALSLAILVPLTLFYGMTVFYPAPTYQQTDELKKVQESLEQVNNELDKLRQDRDVIFDKQVDEFKKTLELSLDKSIDSTRKEQLEKQQEEKRALITKLEEPLVTAHTAASQYHAKLNLIISAGIGILLIILGLFFPAGAIGSGILFGGTVCVAVSFIQHWHLFNEKIHFMLLLGSVILIILIGYYMFSRQRKQA